MKKKTILLTAIMMAAAVPTNCLAASSWRKLNDEVYLNLDEMCYVRNAEERTCGREYVITLKPTNLSAYAYSKSIKVGADVSTGAKQTIVQYSKDKSFKKDVTTRAYRNAYYKGIVEANIVDRELYRPLIWVEGANSESSSTDGFGLWYYSSSTRTISQNGENITYRKIESYEDRSQSLEINDTALRIVRNKTTNPYVFNIPNVQDGGKYYVRVRTQHEKDGQKFYSEWATIKVKE